VVYVAPHIAVVPLRAEPSNRAEQTSDVLCGERLRVVDEIENTGDAWLHVRCEDGYSGWIQRRRASRIDDGWPGEEPVRIGTRDAALVDPGSGVVQRRLVFGSRLRRVRGDADAIVAQLSDGTTGRLPVDIEPPFYGEATSPRERFRAVLTALLGIPYRWGGRSVQGFDCSGLAQFVFRELDLSIPRDASDQEAVLRRGAVKISRDAIALGDVLFWGKGDAATHVALALDAEQFVHARVWVRIGRMTSGRDADLERIFRGAWRHADLHGRLARQDGD